MHIQAHTTEGLYLVDTHYQSGLRPEAVTSTSSSEQSVILSYNGHDLTPYSVVSSFNYPAVEDSSLLTPVSNAASPPLPNRKGMQYASHSASRTQQPTPPNTSAMYYSYDINASSQSSSPLTLHPQAAENAFEMTSFQGQCHSPNDTQHPSPKDEVPPPIGQPYLGSYRVSGTGNETNDSFGDYSNFTGLESSYLTRDQAPDPVSGPQLHVPIDGTAVPQAPVLSQPHPEQYRQSQTVGLGDYPDGLAHHRAHVHGNSQPGVSSSPGRRRQPGQSQEQPRKLKQPRRRIPRSGTSRVQTAKPETVIQVNETMPVDAEQHPPLTLRSNAPAEDRFLFDLRQKYNGEKGKGMWEDIAAEYAKKYPPMEKAALQMKISRAVAKYGEWPEQETNALMDAYKYDEETRYERLLDAMKRRGGGKAWDWKPAHIEAKLVTLGLEEPNVDERTNTRRRKRAAQRRRENLQGLQNLSMISNWPSVPQQSLHPSLSFHPMRQMPGFEVPGDQNLLAPSFTEEQNSKIVDEIWNMRYTKTQLDPGTSNSDAMGMAYGDSEATAKGQARAVQAEQANTVFHMPLSR
ncbi:hypothetical protein VTK73DRAFT_8651 [Phialemonium thermophilum]|uniref:Myb-like domain-containing protein n=1 Tax=Phialemonium thermophilum TaxID=223376 RepID=A0ABR3W735_9PEZI